MNIELISLQRISCCLAFFAIRNKARIIRPILLCVVVLLIVKVTADLLMYG